MRRAITAISLMLFGASILIFISALLRPVLRGSNTQEENSQTEIYESSASRKKTIETSALEDTQNPAIVNQSDVSITQAERKVGQPQMVSSNASIQSADAGDLPSLVAPTDNVTDRNRGNSSAKPALATSAETTILRIDEQSPQPVNAMAAEEKRPPPQEATSLLVLGDGSFSPGGARPKAIVQRAIDEIIPLIQARSLDKVIVEGHADISIPDGFNPDQGSKWNKIISTLRAKSVAKVLMEKGVAGDRISFDGFGDTVPLASNLTYEGRSKNRRVEIKLLPPRQ